MRGMSAPISSHLIAPHLQELDGDIIRLYAFQSQDGWAGHVSLVRDGRRVPVFAWRGHLAEAIEQIGQAGFSLGPFRAGEVGLIPGRVAVARRAQSC